MQIVQPRAFEFKNQKDAQQQLTNHLVEQRKNTRHLELRSPTQLMFNKKGILEGEYRCTSTALPQLCSGLSPGLYLLIASLLGRSEKDQEDRDPDLAINIFNDLVRRRFGRIAGKSLVLDTKERLVDGMVSPRYEYFSNSELLQRSREFVQRGKPEVAFHEAYLMGRRMMLRYLGLEPIFTITERRTNEPFFGGFHFANSESGDCSLRVSALINRQICDNKAIGGFHEGGRVIHARGPKFELKFLELLDKVRKKAAEATILKTNVLRLMDSRLGLGGLLASHDKRRQQISTQLNAVGVPKLTADAVVATVLRDGSYGAGSKRADYQDRNAYDVFNALTSVAKLEALDVREHLEGLAYQLLLGKFSLN